MTKLDDLHKTEALQPGDECEFRYPGAGRLWIKGVVVSNGGSHHWSIRNAETGDVNHYFYIEHVRAPGTDPWSV